MLHVHETEAVVHQQVFQVHQAFSHPHAAGRYFPPVETGFRLRQAQLDVLGGNQVVRYPEVVKMTFVQHGFKIVPVYDAFFHSAVQRRQVHHLETYVFYLHLFGAQDVSPLIGRFPSAIGLQAEDALQVGDGIARPGRAGLHHQVEPASVQPHAAHIGSLPAQEPPQGELDGEVFHIQEGVHAGGEGLFVQHQYVFYQEGFEGADGNIPQRDFRVCVFLNGGDDAFADSRLHPRGLNGHQPCQQQNHQQCQYPGSYFYGAAHNPTNLEFVLK